MSIRSSDKDSEKEESNCGSENEEDSQASNDTEDRVLCLEKKNANLEKEVDDLRSRVKSLEGAQGNSAATCTPKKPKKKILSEEEAETFRRNEKTKEKVDDAIKSTEHDEKITPRILTKTLVKIVFTEDERKVTSQRKLGYWRLQYIKEKVMRRFSVIKEAEKDLWNHCKLGVTDMLLPVPPPPPPPPADNGDQDVVDDATDGEDNSN